MNDRDQFESRTVRSTVQRVAPSVDDAVHRNSGVESLSEVTPGRFDERGQTLQDYLIGISVFLVVVFFVASTVLPSLLAPFERTTGGDEIAQADRISETIVQNLSVVGAPNELRTSHVENLVGKDTDALRTRYRVPDTAYVNVSVTTLDRSAIVTSSTGTSLASDKRALGSSPGTSARIITLSDGSCDPACRLVVRVW